MQHLWVYIKANDLQKPEDKRMILCDSALKKITGGEPEILGFACGDPPPHHPDRFECCLTVIDRVWSCL